LLSLCHPLTLFFPYTTLLRSFGPVIFVSLHFSESELRISYILPVKIWVGMPVLILLTTAFPLSTTPGTPVACSTQETRTRHTVFVASTSTGHMNPILESSEPTKRLYGVSGAACQPLSVL